MKGYGYRIEGADDVASFFENPFYFARARKTISIEKIFSDRNLCGVWFFHDLAKIPAVTSSLQTGFITRLILDALPNTSIEPDPCFEEGIASVLLHSIPDGAGEGPFVREVCLPSEAIQIWNGKTWVSKNDIKDKGAFIYDLICLQNYTYPDELKSIQDKSEFGFLSIGKLGDHDIFGDGLNNPLKSAWKTFSNQDLFQSHGPTTGFIHTLVTTDKKGNAYHVCFMQDPNPNRGGPLGVPNHIEYLATAFYNQLRQSKDSENTPNKTRTFLKKFFESSQSLFSGNLKPDQCHFYYHTWPSRSRSECFVQTDLQFREGRFVYNGSKKYQIIPNSLRRAYEQNVNQQASYNSLSVPQP
ncbi:MAG: hypothetical protein K9G62_06970 [Alphaproteobacteria bacterium]|nr:hypothetical protein [Alphaproteobacteria bacterium]